MKTFLLNFTLPYTPSTTYYIESIENLKNNNYIFVMFSHTRHMKIIQPFLYSSFIFRIFSYETHRNVTPQPHFTSTHHPSHNIWKVWKVWKIIIIYFSCLLIRDKWKLSHPCYKLFIIHFCMSSHMKHMKTFLPKFTSPYTPFITYYMKSMK